MPDGRQLVPRDRLEALTTLSRECGPVLVSPELLRRLLSHIEVLEETVGFYAGDFCEVCGCTSQMACEAGCGWAEFHVCTTCAELPPDPQVLAMRDTTPLFAALHAALALTGDEPMERQDEVWTALEEAVQAGAVAARVFTPSATP